VSVPLDFRGRRLDLANVFRDWRTAKEAARELGTETGSVFGLIKRMHGERILEADSDPGPPTRGTQYRLTHEARIALDEVVDRTLGCRQEAGQLTDDQRLLIVRGDALADIEKVLADPGLSSAIAWGSWLGASWLLAMAPDCDAHAWRKLATVLEEAGYRCERGRIDELQSASRLRDQAASNLERAGANR
jgi:hypothetical protein